MAKSMRPGGGGRFQKLEREIAKDPKVHDAAAVAAMLGRRKYGKGEFQKMAAAGRKRAE